MDSHFDREHRQIPTKSHFLKELERRAKKIREAGQSQITGGIEGEEELARWEHGGIHVVVRPDDPQGIIRISIGGGHDLPVNLNYCTIRGDVGKCIALLEQAIAALRACPE